MMGPVLFVQASAQMWVLSCVSPSVGKQSALHSPHNRQGRMFWHHLEISLSQKVTKILSRQPTLKKGVGEKLDLGLVSDLPTTSVMSASFSEVERIPPY